MDHEKAYKEALERAKEYLENSASTGASMYAVNDALKGIFPELAESEDERIRKEILDFIQLCLSRTDFGSRSIALRKEDAEMFEKWIAYLEKQKEQKFKEWRPLEESMEALLLAIEGKWDAIKPTGYMSRRLEDLYDGLVNTFNIRETYLPKTNYANMIFRLQPHMTKYYTAIVSEKIFTALQEIDTRLFVPPTYAEVFDWLLDRGLCISVYALDLSDGILWNSQLTDVTNDKFDGSFGYKETFVKAADAAILKAIEILKEKL